MELIFLTRSRTGHRRTHLGGLATAGLVVALVAGGAGLFHAGSRFAPAPADPRPELYAAALDAAVAAERREVDAAVRETRHHLDALAVELGELNARLVRLDVLGARLVDMAGLEKGEFDFSRPPGQGGPAPGAAATPMEVPDFLASLAALNARLEDRAPKLRAIESTLLDRKIEDEVRPAGRPVESGWVSSGFGMRTDPVTGRRSRHEGVDFAGARGTKVLSVASGVVVFAGRRRGFGNVVEVHHGNGYTTRYAHNSKNLVEAGVTVRKGEPIALMGSTGRTTGTHVHFELHHEGRPVDPREFIRAGR